MSALTLKVAVNLVNEAITAGRAIAAAPLTIAVLDAGGHLIALQREDGASLLRPHVAIGKAWGAIALGKGSRLLALDAQQRPAFIAALNSLGQGSVVPAPGGVLVRDQDGNVLGRWGSAAICRMSTSSARSMPSRRWGWWRMRGWRLDLR